jgi:hypothetical protein
VHINPEKPKFGQKHAKNTGICSITTNISLNTAYALAIFGSCAIITVGIKDTTD